jgi:hypothetical protein
MKTRGTGLLMAWTDVDPEYEADFNRWYNEEHIQHLLKVPGFLSAGRYRALKGAPKYLAMYELEDHNVLRSSAFLDEVRYKPSPWRTKASGGHVGRNMMLNLYRQIFRAHQPNPRHGADVEVSADRPNGYSGPHGGGVQRLVQYGLCAWVSDRAGLHPGAPLRRSRLSAEIHDGL